MSQKILTSAAYLQCTTAWSRADRSVTLSLSRYSRAPLPPEPVFHVSACSRVLFEQSPPAALLATPGQLTTNSTCYAPATKECY